MTTINIGGKRVTVDDAFLSLPPEQQQATVEEIAAQMGAAPAQAAPDMYASGNVKRLSGAVTPKGREAPTLMGGLTTFLEHGISDLPIVGPLLQGTGDAISTNLQGLVTGQDPKALQAALDERRRARDATYPLTAMSGALTGNVASMAGLGATQAGAQALGLTGKLLPRIGNSALSGGAIAGTDAAVRGNDPLTAAATGAAFGAGIPMVGGMVSQGIKALGRKAAPVIGAITDPAGEAGRRVGVAYNRDAAANPGMLATQADEGVARANNLPLLNVDRGGETTRALARSVANQSPEARAVIEKTASDRFAGQGTRASAFVERLAGGSADDLALKEGLRKTAQLVNDPAYKKAFNSPAAQQVWTQDLADLFGAPSFLSAVRSAETRAANRSVVEGFQPVKNPFQFNADGSITLKPGATPNLRFWDQVKRNLDGMIDETKDRTMRSDLVGLKQKLVSLLDATVPSYKTARQGASAFFGADDALEAGKLFARNGRAVPEARAAFAKLSAPEQKAFGIGYASELIDRIKSVGDRANVINQVFKNPASREMIELVFGKAKARELEAYIRVEDIVDKLRGAMGNSTTARQLMEMGIGAGSGFALTGGDWKGALGGAAFAKGARVVGQKLDDRVMQEVAKLLLSGDETALKKAVFNASMSEEWMKALDRIGMSLDVATRGAALTAA
jgi:hypothetical protein